MTTTPEELCEFIMAEARGEEIEFENAGGWVKKSVGIWMIDAKYRIVPKPKKKIVLRRAVVRTNTGTYFVPTSLYESESQVKSKLTYYTFIGWIGDPIEIEVEEESK